MKDKKIRVLAAVLLIILAGVAVYAVTGNNGNPEPAAKAAAEAAAEHAAENTEEPAVRAEETAVPENGSQEKEQPFLIQVTEDDPSIAYVLVRLQNGAGLLPLPTEGEYTKTIRQTAPDGSEAVNVLHLTTNGFWMEDANCEGHDCVNEGEVTLENREERVLWNMVICLPHQLSAELITRQEALDLIGQ